MLAYGLPSLQWWGDLQYLTLNEYSSLVTKVNHCFSKNNPALRKALKSYGEEFIQVLLTVADQVLKRAVGEGSLSLRSHWVCGGRVVGSVNG